MKLNIHIGANCTDDDLLIKSLMKNAVAFEEQGTLVPPFGKYRKDLRETVQSAGDGAATARDGEAFKASVLENSKADTIVLSNPNYICVPNRIFENGEFYALLENKIQATCTLFPEDEITFFIGTRNPATFVPAAYAESKKDNIIDYLEGIHLDHIDWSNLVARILRVAPQVKVVAWANEDTPFIWAQLIRTMAGIAETVPITGGYDLYSTLLTDDGQRHFVTYLRQHPPRTQLEKRRIMAAFVERFGKPDAVEEVFELEGWTPELVDGLTQHYLRDLEKLRSNPAISFVAPA